MTDLSGAIPFDKYDLDAVRRAETLGYPTIAPILDDLLGWTVDMHWPVAEPMSRFLFKLGQAIQPPIERLLSSNDHTGKWQVLQQIMHYMPRSTAEGLRRELERLARHPEAGDRREQIDAIAVELLDWLDEHEARADGETFRRSGV